MFTYDDDERDSFWDFGPDFEMRCRALTAGVGFGILSWLALFWFIRRFLGT